MLATPTSCASASTGEPASDVPGGPASRSGGASIPG